LINIDAINPDWPRPIHLPDEEETLDKQVASGAVAARERGLVPQSGDWERPYRWVTPEEVEEIEVPATDKTSSYEMPKYDMSWDALVETQLLNWIHMNKNKEIDIRSIEDAWRNPDSILGDKIKDTDNFVLTLGSSWYFGESEEAVKEEVLKDYISPKGRYFNSYYPPRLTPKPEWASDENDPFPEIPSDIKEIHYDDIPDFYSKHKYGEALQQFGSSMC